MTEVRDKLGGDLDRTRATLKRRTEEKVINFLKLDFIREGETIIRERFTYCLRFISQL